VKLFKLIWDAVGSEFGSRHEWYEINYSGNQEQMRLDMARFAGVRGLTDGFDALVEQCLSEYDLDGWAGGPWLDGGDSRAGGAGG
ncbi:MAG: paerucumarin biosynthesis protein PvcC, partial [Solirubrobacteraceae bacterium]|nr:paerucumarin biosynthesis protein PvcC [Solirubrobacteraceae bacterium]